jgi:hypothetical protein
LAERRGAATVLAPVWMRCALLPFARSRLEVSSSIRGVDMLLRSFSRYVWLGRGSATTFRPWRSCDGGTCGTAGRCHALCQTSALA